MEVHKARHKGELCREKEGDNPEGYVNYYPEHWDVPGAEAAALHCRSFPARTHSGLQLEPV